MKDLELVTFIKTTLTQRGEGKDKEDPVRIITQYWDMDGSLVFEIDPFKSEESIVKTFVKIKE